MGGKTKQSQRTKNNARPSSSGRSALLLSNVKLEGGGMNTSGAEFPALFPTLVAPSIDPLVSPELQLCIKKLNKKDPITKTKALQELSELVSNSKVDDVVMVLPSWAHFYKILTADPDRKVREATQACHGTIVSVCGRRIAPHLKQLMPAWLQAQYDEHAPAQANAQNSLAKTFPDSKLPEVLSFCKSEVVTHLVDNLIGSGEAAFIRKSDTAEEREAQLARVAAGSLHALQYAALHVPRAHDDWLWARLAALLQAAAFWKRAAHADSRVRAAWFGAVGRVAQRFRGRFAERFGQRALRVLVGGREASPLAAAQLWDCMLLFMDNVEDWYKYLDKKELLNKRIFDVLESGGWGDARHLSNMLLPLLAHLPEEMLTKEFYITFFDAMFTGLDKKTILGSKSERQSWITSLDECLRYLSIQQRDYVLEMVTSVHRTWLERILSDAHEGRIKTNLIEHSAGRMAALVKYWLKQAKEGRSEKFDQLIRNFWQNVGATVTAQVDKLNTDHAAIGKALQAHTLLFQTLKSSFAQEAKRRRSITFDDSPTPERTQEPRKPSEEPCDPSIVERYYHNLNDVVDKICGHYFEFASKKEISSPVLTPLVTLLAEFDSARLFTAVARQFGYDSPYRLYEGVLRGWLAGDTMRCRVLVEIVFMLIKHCSEPEQDALFDSFKQFPPSVVEWCMCVSLSPSPPAPPAARRWLRGAAAAGGAGGACARVIRTGDPAALTLLLMCLDDDDSGEILIGESGVSSMSSRLSAALEAAESLAAPALAAAATLAARLAQRRAAPRLLLALFRLTLLLPEESERLPAACGGAVRAAWRRGLRAGAARDARLAAAAALHRHLHLRSNLPENLLPPSITSNDEQNTKRTLDIKQIEHAVSLCLCLLPDDAREAAEIADFTRRVFDFEPTDPRAVEAFVLRHSIVRGDINCPFEDGEITKWIIDDCNRETIDEVREDDLVSHLTDCVFRCMYLRTIFLHKSDEDSDTWCDALLSDDYFVAELCKVLHDVVVVSTMCDAYAFSPHYELLDEATRRLNALVEDIMSCARHAHAHVRRALAERAAGAGYYWCFAGGRLTPPAPGGTDSGQEETDKNETVQEKIDSSRSETESDLNKNETENIENRNNAESDDVESLDFGNMKEMITGSGYFHTLQAADLGRGSGTAALRTRYLLMLRCYCAAHCADDAFLRDVTATQRDCDADVIVNAYYTHNHVMLYEMDVTSSPWSRVASNAAVCDYLAALVAQRGRELPAHQWDFVNITLCNLLTSVRRSLAAWGCSKVAMLARSVLNLYIEVEKFIGSVKDTCLRKQPSEHVARLPHEWADMFAPDLRANMLAIVMFVLESACKTSVTANHIAVMDALIRCTRRLPAGGAGAGAGGAARRAAGTLGAPAAPCFHYLAYELLLVMLKPMVLDDAALLAAWSGAEEAEDERPAPRFSLLQYDDALRALRDLVPAAIAHVRVCEAACALAPRSDAHALALGWCLLAEAAAAQCRLARGDLHHHYIQIYRERKYAEPLLTTALRLLPAEVLAHAQPGAAPALPRHIEMFNRPIDIDVYKYCGAASVSHAACRALRACVCGAGAGEARGWRGAAPHKHATLLDNIVQTYITPSVVKEEFTLVQQRASELEDMEITFHWSTYELTCILTVEERPIELRVALSRSHPLGLPRLTAPHHAPAGNTNWLVMYMGYQNGSLLNALKMWIAAVSRKVERSAQCYICYCRLHFATGRLPAVLCHQCRNRFHTACLRKWFATSNKSNCPLCRASF